MDDRLLDDVKALLDKDFGDDRILKQILRACENNEVISNYERNYVKKLAETHLGRRPEISSKSPPQTPVEEKPSVPDVILPETNSTHKTQTFQQQKSPSTTPRTSSTSSKNSKIMLGIVGVVLVIIIAAGASFTTFSNDPKSPVENDPITSVNAALSIQTDLPSYNNKDLISISGFSESSGTAVIEITNQKNELVWKDEISIKSNGKYSTLAIAGGPGWDSSGTYTIKVDNGVETTSSTFSFTV